MVRGGHAQKMRNCERNRFTNKFLQSGRFPCTHIPCKPLVAKIALLMSCSSLLTIGNASDLPSLPNWDFIETPFGPIKMREFGSPTDPLVILVHGMMDNEFIRNEWNPTAQKLAENNFHVLVPDFHSAPSMLRPAALVGKVFQDLLLNTFLPHNKMVPSRYHGVVKRKLVVMGKSWGARMAAEAGALDEVVAVALVVPPFTRNTAAKMLQNIKGRLAVLLVKDDDVVDFTEAKKTIKTAIANREITWVEAEKGGHRVLDEFIPHLLSFSASFLPEYLHENDKEEM